MPLPLLAIGALGAAGALKTLHGGIRYAENMRYWNQYKKNTGYSPRYRARSGYYDFLSVGSSAANTVGMSYGSLYNYYNGW